MSAEYKRRREISILLCEVAVCNELTAWTPTPVRPTEVNENGQRRDEIHLGLRAKVHHKRWLYVHLLGLLIQRCYNVEARPLEDGVTRFEVGSTAPRPREAGAGGTFPSTSATDWLDVFPCVAPESNDWAMRLAKLSGHLEYVPHIHTAVLGGMGAITETTLDALRALGIQDGRLARLCGKLQEVLVEDTCTADRMWQAMRRTAPAGNGGVQGAAQSAPGVVAGLQVASPRAGPAGGIGGNPGAAPAALGRGANRAIVDPG